MQQLIGAIESGGTKFNCAVGLRSGEVIEHTQIPTRDPANTLSEVLAFFERAQTAVGSIAAFGIGAFGPIDLRIGSPTYGQVLRTPKAGWQGTDLRAPLLRRFGCPIALDTDVNAAALAELQLGAAKGLRSVAYVTVGTGIGGGAVINGRTLTGLLHPEMGHLPVRRHAGDQQFSGVCPFHGDCLEGLASGPAILARWGSTVDQWAPDHPGFEIVGSYLGQLTASLALILSSERIVFGGGAMNSGKLLPSIRRATSDLLNGYLPYFPAESDLRDYICAPGLDKRSGLIGALLLGGAAAEATASA